MLRDFGILCAGGHGMVLLRVMGGFNSHGMVKDILRRSHLELNVS